MRRHQFGFTIARRCLGFFLCVVFLLVLFGVMAEAERIDLVRATLGYTHSAVCFFP